MKSIIINKSIEGSYVESFNDEDYVNKFSITINEGEESELKISQYNSSTEETTAISMNGSREIVDIAEMILENRDLITGTF